MDYITMAMAGIGTGIIVGLGLYTINRIYSMMPNDFIESKNDAGIEKIINTHQESF
jgi:hypothetical protein